MLFTIFAHLLKLSTSKTVISVMIRKPQYVSGPEQALQRIWDSLPEETICKSVVDFRRRLKASIKVDGGHFEHFLK